MWCVPQYANAGCQGDGTGPRANARVSDENEQCPGSRDWARNWPFLEIVEDIPAGGEVFADYEISELC